MIFRGLIALAFGTLGLGITEYVAMGLLPYWASSFEINVRAIPLSLDDGSSGLNVIM